MNAHGTSAVTRALRAHLAAVDHRRHLANAGAAGLHAGVDVAPRRGRPDRTTKEEMTRR